MIKISNNPRHYGVPHDEWRRNQRESVEFIVNSESNVLGLSAPTGSGKTAVAAGLSENLGVTAITATKVLQNQYEGYGFFRLFGRGNYVCPHLSRMGVETMCDSCIFSNAPTSCPDFVYCNYYNAVNRSIKEKKVVLNYAYYQLINRSLNSTVDKSKRSAIYFDEAHEIRNVLFSVSELHFSLDKLRGRYVTLPEWNAFRIENLTQPMRKKEAGRWLLHCARVIENSLSSIPESTKDPKLARKRNSLKRAFDRFFDLAQELSSRPEDFYIQGGKKRGIGYIKIHPLTVVGQVQRKLFGSSDSRHIFTSATLGKPETFFERVLGIHDYEWRDVPSNFTPEQMPVYYHTDAPKMGYKSTENDRKKRASIIAEMIESVDGSGLVLSSSYRDCTDIAQRLFKTFGDRVLMIDQDTGDSIAKMRTFEEAKRRVPNTILVTPSFWEGYDGVDDKFCIMAKTPFPMMDEAGKARANRDMKVYLWETAIKIEQGAGRVRRGDISHYENGGDINRLVAIVDGNYTRVKSQFSPHFKKCLTRW